MNLCELINYVKERDGMTGRDLMARARDKGAPVPTGLFRLSNPNNPMEVFPRKRTIIGLEAALEVSREDIVAAALESLGLASSDVVEIHIAAVHVHTDGNQDQAWTPPEEGHARWIVIVPVESTPDEVLDGIASGRLRLRAGATQASATGA